MGRLEVGDERGAPTTEACHGGGELDLAREGALGGESGGGGRPGGGRPQRSGASGRWAWLRLGPASSGGSAGRGG